MHMRHYGRKKSHSRTRIISALVAGLFAVAMVYLFILAPDTVDRVAIPEDIAVPISNIANLTETLQLESLVRTESGFDATVVEQYIFVYTNAERTEMGIAGLSSVPLISDIAREHSLDMATRDYFEHESPEGNDPADRGIAMGYECRKDYGTYYTYGLAENIFLSHTYSSYMAEGVKSSYNWLKDEQVLAEEIVEGWMNSPGHRENILTKDYSEIGVGVVITDDEEVYATQNFC